MGSNVAYVATLKSASLRTVEFTISKDGTILDCSDVDLLNYRKETLLGKNVSVLVPQQWRKKHESYLKMYNQTRSSDSFVRVVPMVMGNGTVAPVSIHVKRKSINQVNVYSASITVTPEALVLILSLSPMGIIDGCLFSDELVVPFLGYSRSEFMDRDIKLFLPQVDVIANRDNMEETPMQGKHKDGKGLFLGWFPGFDHF